MMVVPPELGFPREAAAGVVSMDGGVAVESGPPSTVISNPQHERTKSFLRRMRQEEEQAASDVDAG